MKLPEMIIFDYGGTLLYEPGFDPAAIERTACEHLTANPLGLSAEQINEHAQSLFKRFAEARKIGVEIHQHQYMRLVYESLGLEFDVPYSELEELSWTAASTGAVMPYADEMLDYLNAAGIRTAVVSNIGWSQEALINRLNRLLPRNRFEFVIASSSYGVRKPDRLLFDIALIKAKLPSEKVWYCGDTPAADVVGAHNARLFPVYYTGDAPGGTYRPSQRHGQTDIDFPHLTIDDWRKLQPVLEALR